MTAPDAGSTSNSAPMIAGTPGDYTLSVQLPDQTMTSVVIEDLTPAHWYFAGKAYNSAGVESDFSSPANKLIQ